MKKYNYISKYFLFRGKESALDFLTESDLKQINRYLKKRNYASPKSLLTVRSCIFKVLWHIRKPIFSITVEDVEDFFFEINQNYSLKYCNALRANLDSFFKDLQNRIRRDNPMFVNPVPDFRFTTQQQINGNPIDDEKDKYTIKQIKEILHKVYFNTSSYIPERTQFSILLLEIFTGARISEIVSIKKEHTFLNERYIFTGIEPGARKSNQNAETIHDALLLIIPKEVAIILREFIISQGKFTKSEWLFPGRDEGEHISDNTHRQYLHDLNLPYAKEIKPHKFRKTLISFMMNPNNSMRVPGWVPYRLTHHTPGDSLLRDYNFQTRDEHRTYYDLALPIEYKEILDYIRRL